MPEQMIEGITRVEALVTKAVRLLNRRMKQFVAIGAVLLAAAGTAAVFAINAASDAREARDARDAAVVETCRARNAAFRATRTKFDAMFDIFDALVTDAQGREVMANLRAIPDPVDTDCNHDGTVDSADYPQE